MKLLLMYSTHAPSEEHLRRLCLMGKEIQVEIARSEAEAVRLAEDAEVIFGHRYLRQAMPHASHLKWVQSTAGGVDRLPVETLREKRVLLSRCTFFSDAVAKHAVRLAEALLSRSVEPFLRPWQSKWHIGLEPLPAPKTAIVVGMGHVGREIAKLLKIQGLHVIGTSRTGAGLAEAFCDRTYSIPSWPIYLGEADLCFLALPHTETTRGLFNEAILRRLPPHAVLVNVGRGETLVTEALVRLLKEGYLGGAGLDVIFPNPASDEDPIWQTPRLIITPHIAAHFPGRAQAIERYFERQLERYLKGETPLDRVDLDQEMTDFGKETSYVHRSHHSSL